MRRPKKKNPRVGCKGGDYLMPVSFRDLSETEVREVQARYAEGFWTQRMLASILDLPVSVVAKAVRCSTVNIRRVRAELMKGRP